MIKKSGVFTTVIILINYFTLQTEAGLDFCNCIYAKDCATFTSLLLNSPVNQLDSIIERIRNSGCGSNIEEEPKVCCPSPGANTFVPTKSKKSPKKKDYHSFPSSTEERWIWDRRPIVVEDRRAMDFETNRLRNSNELLKTNLIDDYLDWKTQRNCPPILYKEKYDSSHNHHNHFHGHPHIHIHHGYDEKWPINHENGFHKTTKPRHRDGAIIYPDTRFMPDYMVPFRPKIMPTRAVAIATVPMATEMTMTTPTIPLITTEMPSPIDPLNSPNCGVTLGQRIIGGDEALPGEFPWITRIAYLNMTDNSIAYRCSGSFITNRHILTAAHCVTNLDRSLTLSHVRLVNSDPLIDCNNLDRPCGDNSNILSIERTFIHPNYDRPRRTNDIAIIKINRPQNAAVNFGTICLPPSSNANNLTDNLLGSTGIVAGWSNNEGTETNDLRVRYLRLSIMNNTECAQRYNNFREGFAEQINIGAGMLCTQGQSGGADVCRGDSGGPLMDDGSSDSFSRNGRYTLLGIVAFGPSCGLADLLPGVYMRISEFVSWIRENAR